MFVAFKFHVQFYFLYSKSNCYFGLKTSNSSNSKATTAKFNYIDFFPLLTVYKTHRTKKKSFSISGTKLCQVLSSNFRYCILFYRNILYIVYVSPISITRTLNDSNFLYYSTFVWQSIVSVSNNELDKLDFTKEKKNVIESTLGSF